jgi:hypothetical protein
MSVVASTPAALAAVLGLENAFSNSTKQDAEDAEDAETVGEGAADSDANGDDSTGESGI